MRCNINREIGGGVNAGSMTYRGNGSDDRTVEFPISPAVIFVHQGTTSESYLATIDKCLSMVQGEAIGAVNVSGSVRLILTDKTFRIINPSGGNKFNVSGYFYRIIYVY